MVVTWSIRAATGPGGSRTISMSREPREPREQGGFFGRAAQARPEPGFAFGYAGQAHIKCVRVLPTIPTPQLSRAAGSLSTTWKGSPSRAPRERCAAVSLSLVWKCSPSRAAQMQGGIFGRGPSAHKVREGPAKNSNAAVEPRSRRASQPVSRVLSWIIIHLDRKSPIGLKQPTRKRRGPRHCFPIWSCSGWGLPCHDCYQPRGALLPHHFTLTRRRIARQRYAGRYTFCCTGRRLAPPRRYLAPCPAEPGLSSNQASFELRSNYAGSAIIRLTRRALYQINCAWWRSTGYRDDAGCGDYA